MHRRKRSLMQKFVTSHMMVLTLVFAVTGFFYYINSIRLTRQETIMTGANIIENGKKEIDNKLEALLNLNLPLITGDDVRLLAAMSRPFPLDSHIELNRTRERLYVYTMMNDFNISLTLFFKNNDLFISNKAVGVYSKAYFDTIMNHSDIPYEEWKSIINSQNQYRILTNYGTGKQKTVDIIHDLPSFPKANGVAMIISIDGKTLDSIFDPLLQFKGSYYFITGSDGTLYYSNASPEIAHSLLDHARISNGDYLVSRARSEIVGFQYTALIPHNALYYREYRFIGNFVVVYLLLMFISFILSIYTSYKNVKPLKLVVDRIAQNQGIHIGKNDNEAEFIGLAFTELLYGNESLIMTMQDNLLSKLLNGTTLTESEVHMANTHLRQIFEYDQYQVAVIKVMEFAGTRSSEEYVLVNAMQKVAADRITALLPDNVFVHRLDYDKIALIFCLSPDTSQYAIADTLKQCVSALEKIKIPVICAVGDTKKISDQIYMSCQNAGWLLETANISREQSIYWFSSRSVEYDSFYYPPESQRRFSNLILAGDTAAALKELAMLCEINLHSKKISEREKSYFTGALSSDFLFIKKTIGQLPDEAEEQFHYIVTQMQKNPYYEINEAYFNILTELLASYADQKVNERDNTLLEHIYAHVREKFNDPAFSVPDIAYSLDMAENYISTFFKHNTGENLSAYIEDVRMDAALVYMSERKMSMIEISEKVGYANVNTFYKAFKRRYGVPPKRYQQNMDNAINKQALPPIRCDKSL